MLSSGLSSETTHREVPTFQRRYFVKDLFAAEQLFADFSDVSFASPATLERFLNDGLLQHSFTDLRVNVGDRTQAEQAISLARECDCAEKFWLCIQSQGTIVEDASDTVYWMANRDCLTDGDGTIDERIGRLNQERRLVIEYPISYPNVDRQVRWLISDFVLNVWRYVDLSLDYSSFGAMPVDKLSELEFWFVHLIQWRNKSKRKMQFAWEDAEREYAGFVRPVFVSDDSKLYYNRRHFDFSQDTALFDFEKWRGASGEDIPFAQLNRLGAYVNMTSEEVFFNLPVARQMWSLVDFFENERFASVNETPFVCCIMMNWLARGWS